MSLSEIPRDADSDALHRLRTTESELRAVLYCISHDVRSPLRAINGFALALQEDYSPTLDGPGLDYVVRIRTAAARMDHMLEGVLRISRISDKVPERDRTDISHMARDIVCGLRENTPPHEVEVDVDVGMEMVSDRALVRTILHELVSNAWKYTRGVRGARIRVSRELAHPGFFAFCVRDNGVGFDSVEAGDRLFGLFQCFHDGSKSSGEGVGLAVARRAAQVLGGDLRGRSRVGGGSEFVCSLPDRTRS